MHVGLKITLAGLVLAGGAAAVTALAPAPPDNSRDASRIVGSLKAPQQALDKIPQKALANIPGVLGVDPSQTRLLGKGKTLTYYAVPAGDKICMVPVDANGEGTFIGCTTLQGFETYGLRMENADRTEQAWLVVPAGAKNALDSVSQDSGWAQHAPNFLVRNNH
jgi:hypothetical protein